MNIKEFTIPVPWGEVAVKAWGDEKNTPVLTIHGIADNASSFDNLIPCLPTSFYYICIDLPSHGKSSPYPPHVFINSIDNVFTYKIIVDHLKRDKYILMGHSWGAQTAILFTQLYPEHVTKLIMLDSVYYFPTDVNNLKEYLTSRIEKLAKINKTLSTREPLMYTYEEAIDKLISNRMFGQLERKAAEALARRSLTPQGDGKFRFTTDPRLKAFVNPFFDIRYSTGLLKKHPVRCPVLIVIASESDLQFRFFKSLLAELRKSCKKLVITKVEGSHDVHNNSPELVAPIVGKFLEYSKSKL